MDRSGKAETERQAGQGAKRAQEAQKLGGAAGVRPHGRRDGRGSSRARGGPEKEETGQSRQEGMRTAGEQGAPRQREDSPGVRAVCHGAVRVERGRRAHGHEMCFCAMALP